MPSKRKKRNQEKPEIVYYEIKIEDWEVACSFGLSFFPGEFGAGDYSEDSDIIFTGEILSPVLKNAKKAKIFITGKPEFENHWDKPLRDERPIGIGWIEIPRGSGILELHALFPCRSLPIITAAAAVDKIQFARVRGTKIRYRKGDIRDLELLTTKRDYGDD